MSPDVRGANLFSNEIISSLTAGVLHVRLSVESSVSMCCPFEKGSVFALHLGGNNTLLCLKTDTVQMHPICVSGGA